MALCALAVSALAAVPNTLTYQGRVQESGALVNGNRDIQIGLCANTSNGGCPDNTNCLYSANQTVAVTNGLFRTTFTIPSGVDMTSPLYLEVREGAAGGGANTCLAPRELLTTSPYAIVAGTVSASGILSGNITGQVNLMGGGVGIGKTNPGAFGTFALLDVFATTTSNSGSSRGAFFTGEANPSASSTGRVWGAHGLAQVSNSNPQNLTSPLTAPGLVGLEGAVNFVGSGIVTAASGVHAYLNNALTGTITNAVNLHASNASNTGTITNLYGLYIDSLTAGANNWGIYESGAQNNYFAGNIGIGTINPAMLLDLNGGAQFGAGATKSTFTAVGGLRFDPGYNPVGAKDAATKGYVDAQVGPGGIYASTGNWSATQNFQNQITASTMIYSSYQGNSIKIGDPSWTVLPGIITIQSQLGSITPGVYGSMMLSGGYASTDATGASVYLGKLRGTYASPSIVQSGDELGRYAFEGWANTGLWAEGASIQAKADGTWTSGSSYPTRLSFNVNPAGGTSFNTVMVINNAGNVGIGMTSPGTKLHMSTGVLTIDGNVAGLSVGVSTFVVTGGNVGVGIANPGAQLDVTAPAGATQATLHLRAPSGAPLLVADQGGGPLIVIDGNAHLGVNGSPLSTSLFEVAPALLAVKQANGFVGVGTANPAYPLHVAGDSYAQGQQIVGSTLTVMGNAFSVGGATFAVTGGRIGIGIAAPQQALHVVGNEVLGGRLITGGAAQAAVNLSSGCGTGATISGTDSGGKITMGTIGNNMCVLAFTASWSASPLCFANMETGGTSTVARATSVTTTGVTFTTSQASYASGDIVAYYCVGR